MKTAKKTALMRLRFVLGANIVMGPGKADLLQGIKETGSIAAAGRRMGMSYKRAWLLVETMNACFKKPLVETSRGGRVHGGAVLTADGERALASYRRMEGLAAAAISDEMKLLGRMLADMSDQK